MADRYFSERQPADDCVACYGCSSLGSRNRNSGAKAAGGSCNQRNFSIETKLIENFHFFSLRYGVLLHEPDKEHSFCFEETLVNVFGTKKGHWYRYAGRFLVFLGACCLNNFKIGARDIRN
jgi:hypothetical protein